ncbi:delta-class carbonic anhydrase [Neptunomonas antarctica]|uniref:Cadmium carbonic anhydrase repeat-containing protein n=1 Tax=Neptunomonas antarctica TaxID=619304 RepID=A0A1N7IWJ6_9GAMM|nr:delta-class carbonic anhydrase [Neptunomonas antarctica]SIS41376.1 hypothetical protein SAMN05421760_101227 [Neptunomonas antarctica]
MKALQLVILAVTAAPFFVNASSSDSAHHKQITNQVMEDQRNFLLVQTKNKGFGPQAPRDIDLKTGSNDRDFSLSPPSAEMNLCNIHFHKNAEHKGGEFTKYAGNGDGHGYQTGYQYSGHLSHAELADFGKKVGETKHGAIYPGDTLEVHYVYSTAQVEPGATLGACLSESIKNPQLRVETQVYVAVNDKEAKNFVSLTKVETVDGLYQAVNIPGNTGVPVEYAGSTTGPGYNEKGSPFQVTWSVRPNVEKVSIGTIDQWLQGNVFDEDHAHGVRNLVTNPTLLSNIAH